MASNESVTEPRGVNTDLEDDSGVYDLDSTNDSFSSFITKSSSKSRVPDDVRLRINSRERQRMHELNDALDALRSVLPNPGGVCAKKLSKMSTLVQARNHIVSLTRSIEDTKRLIALISTRNTSDTSKNMDVKFYPDVPKFPSAFKHQGARFSPYKSSQLEPIGTDPYVRSTLRVQNFSAEPEKTTSNLDYYSVNGPCDSVTNAYAVHGYLAKSAVLQYSSVKSSDEVHTNMSSSPIKISSNSNKSSDKLHANMTSTPIKTSSNSNKKPALKFSVESLLGISCDDINMSPVKHCTDKENIFIPVLK